MRNMQPVQPEALKNMLANSCGKCKTNAARKVAASEATKPPISQAVKQSVCPSVSQSTCLVTDTEEGKHSLSAASLGFAAAASKLCQSDESVRSRSRSSRSRSIGSKRAADARLKVLLACANAIRRQMTRAID